MPDLSFQIESASMAPLASAPHQKLSSAGSASEGPPRIMAEIAENGFISYSFGGIPPAR